MERTLQEDALGEANADGCEEVLLAAGLRELLAVGACHERLPQLAGLPRAVELRLEVAAGAVEEPLGDVRAGGCWQQHLRGCGVVE